jgi:hypothetical protein
VLCCFGGTHPLAGFGIDICKTHGGSFHRRGPFSW